MEWVCAWKQLPSKDGVYLCEMEGHYGIFSFCEGHFQPNDWNDYSAISLGSSFVGDETSIIHWMALPELRTLTLYDVAELVRLRKEREKMQRKKDREKKDASKCNTSTT